MEIKVGKCFRLIRKLGQGAFGEIFLGENTTNKIEVAIKLEPKNTKQPQLFYEARLYQYLLNDPDSNQNEEKGIPQVYFCAVEGDYNIMVMEWPSLEDLFQRSNRKFSLKTVLTIGIQLIERIQYIHKRQFLHRDIKPDNFLIGNHNYNKEHIIFIIDFGLAKRYILKNGQHIEYKENKNLTGTARYASINTHIGIEQGRRDDLESLGYLLIYFYRGQLPWQNLKATTKKEKYEKIMEKKLCTSIDQLTSSCPNEFKRYITYCRNLRFDETPDYDYLKNLFKELFIKNNYQNDSKYDWVENKQLANKQTQFQNLQQQQQLYQQQMLEMIQQNQNDPQSYPNASNIQNFNKNI